MRTRPVWLAVTLAVVCVSDALGQSAEVLQRLAGRYEGTLDVTTNGSSVYIGFRTGANSDVRLELLGDSLVGTLTTQGALTSRSMTLTRTQK